MESSYPCYSSFIHHQRVVPVCSLLEVLEGWQSFPGHCSHHCSSFWVKCPNLSRAQKLCPYQLIWSGWLMTKRPCNDTPAESSAESHWSTGLIWGWSHLKAGRCMSQPLKGSVPEISIKPWFGIPPKGTLDNITISPNLVTNSVISLLQLQYH